MKALVLAIFLLVVVSAPDAFAADGSFVSSDATLNAVWQDSVKTATDMVVPGPLTKDAMGRPCAIDLPKVIIDGVVRDRCPYVGDEAVEGRTLLISTPADVPALRAMILWFAKAQHKDGAIPDSPLFGASKVLFDYNAFWVEDLYNYVLYTGDLALARTTWPALVGLMDRWYPAQMGTGGLLVNRLGDYDYAYIHRPGTTVAYYNAGYVRALRMASSIAGWLGKTASAQAWKRRIPTIAAKFSAAFWDPSAGAFRDTTTGSVDHPQDGNVFAILAGLATKQQSLAALNELETKDMYAWGNSIVDNDTWDTPSWGSDAKERVYPFISYFELLARFGLGLDTSAVDLIRREWGYMAAHGPKTTMWETIGPYGGGPVDRHPSYDSGWSSGAAPALTEYVLGVAPEAPGFSRVRIAPHPADIAWAKGDVPTPHGVVHVYWRYGAEGDFVETVRTPVPGTITVPFGGLATVDGKKTASRSGQPTTARFGAGTHTLIVRF
ncbi:MAG TPA: alpha-L-rhamnosidase C-terminal domain-containing protein [Gaiellaceae bacterium]|nr:alpha-L-rhamnosidase C-terminal domain-containing protein [Gaiellaceae bacterium]